MPDNPYILAIDDEPTVLRQLTRDLKRHFGADYQVLSETDGQQALGLLDELATHLTPVALVVSDQRMSPVDGVRVLDHARTAVPESKRVLLTAYADTDAAIASINRSQVHYYLTKPWDPPEERLVPILRDLLGTWRTSHRPGYGGVRIVGSRWSPRSQALRDLLARNHRPYQFLDVESPDGRAQLEQLGATADELPVVVLPDGERLRNPSRTELASRVGLQTEARASMYDFAIVGGGPAGLAAAVYGASEGLSTVLIDADSPGGQAGTSSRIENYLGFPAGVSGGELAERAVHQARKFGVEIISPQRVCTATRSGPYIDLRCDEGLALSCKAVLLATGVAWRRLDTDGVERLTGRGVYYGATPLSVDDCTDQRIVIVGAGNSAGQAALDLAGKGAHVTIVVRGARLDEKMSQYLVDRIEHPEDGAPTIDVLLRAEVTRAGGDERLEAVRVVQHETGEERSLPAQYLLVFIGAIPNTEWLGDLVARDDHGFILTGPDLTPGHLSSWPLQRAPTMFETSEPGIYAAGDVRHDSIKRVASAVGEGSVVVHFVHRHLATL